MMFMFICRPNLQTGQVQDEEKQNRTNIDIQGANALPSISQTQTRGQGAYLNGTQNNDVITRSTKWINFIFVPVLLRIPLTILLLLGIGHHDKELESLPSFTTFDDEFTRLDAVYTRNSNRNNDTPLSWANGN